MKLTQSKSSVTDRQKDLLRRRLLLGTLLGASLGLAGCNRKSNETSAAGPGVATTAPIASAVMPTALTAEVWKSPFCGCCKLWVQHLETNGFQVTAHDVQDTAPMRSELGMPKQYGSCHSARISGYAIEGHVPAADIKRLLKEKPDAIGLSVPGMPIGSPGMEQGDMRDKYDVLLVLRNGQTKVFQSHS